jgi:hypothetical protein
VDDGVVCGALDGTSAPRQSLVVGSSDATGIIGMCDSWAWIAKFPALNSTRSVAGVERDGGARRQKAATVKGALHGEQP